MFREKPAYFWILCMLNYSSMCHFSQLDIEKNEHPLLKNFCASNLTFFCFKNKANFRTLKSGPNNSQPDKRNKKVDAYGFGTKCKNWFKLQNKDLKANILVNGFTTESIKIELSVKQGDALLCSLFILCMILACNQILHIFALN